MKYILLPIALGLCLSCSSNKEKNPEENVRQILPETPTEVTVARLETKTFTSEIVSNGKIASVNVAEVRFQSAEPIAKIYVHNGERVSKGQNIATLHPFTFDSKLEQTRNELERTRLELQDILIGQGYKLQDTTSIPTEVMKLAKVKSGYSNALNQYELAKFQKNQGTLRAPINGVVANISAKVNTIANTAEAFCNIVDLNNMEVTFKVLENEMGLIKKGDKVQVAPFSISDEKMSGKISEINPWIDENGMVQVKATIQYHPKMMEGMNVRVHIFRQLDKQWVVPKSAVVMRTNKQVVFVLENGKAMWNYVTTGQENATEYTITSETLQEGDTIIITGTVNLAHESPVTIIEE